MGTIEKPQTPQRTQEATVLEEPLTEAAPAIETQQIARLAQVQTVLLVGVTLVTAMTGWQVWEAQQLRAENQHLQGQLIALQAQSTEREDRTSAVQRAHLADVLFSCAELEMEPGGLFGDEPTGMCETPSYPARARTAAVLAWVGMAAPDESVDLSRALLRHTDLSGVDLSGVNFSDADLRGADLSHANLTGANFFVADMEMIRLDGANLSYADLSRADLTHARLNGTDFSWSNLSGTRFNSTDLSTATLTGVIHTHKPGPGIALTRWPYDFDPEAHGLAAPTLQEQLIPGG